MSDPGPRNPFEGLFGELAKLLSNQGPLNMEVARQLGQWLAAGGQPEGNVDPLDRMRFEELLRVADLHVSAATGLATSVTGRVLAVRPVTRGEWAGLSLDAYAPLLEGLASTMAMPDGEETDDLDPSATELLGSMSQVMGPVLLGMQAGSLVGHLAQRALGQYDLPIPRPASDELLVVPANVNAFAEDWSLPVDDVRLWVCLTEVAHHAVLGRPHMGGRLQALLREYVGGFQPDATALEEKLAGVDPMNPASFQEALGDPTELLGLLQTPAQRQVLSAIEALVVAIEGYVDHVLDDVGHRLIASYSSLSEALRRRRVARGEGDRFVEQLFGLQLDQPQYDRGAAFVTGIIERAGADGLARLWRSERELPTPAEVDAPGLWLERIDLDLDQH